MVLGRRGGRGGVEDPRVVAPERHSVLGDQPELMHRTPFRGLAGRLWSPFVQPVYDEPPLSEWSDPPPLPHQS